MRSKFVFFAVVVALTQVVPLAAAPPKPREIIERAIKAHGGVKALQKASQIGLKGTIETPVKASMTGTVYIQPPNRLRNEMQIDFNNKTFQMTQVFDGSKLWLKVMGKVVEVKDENMVKQTKQNLYVERVGSLVPLTKAKYRLSPLGELTIENKPTVGVRVSSKGQEDVNLYFDAKTYLLAKMEYSNYDAQQMKQTDFEKLFSKYEKMNGIPVPKELVIRSDGKIVGNFAITDLRLVDRLDNSLFKKPE